MIIPCLHLLRTLIRLEGERPEVSHPALMHRTDAGTALATEALAETVAADI